MISSLPRVEQHFRPIQKLGALQWSDPWIAPLFMERSTLSISWKDKIINEEVRARTKQHSVASTLSERILFWLGHMLRRDHQRIPQQALYTGRFRASRGDRVGQEQNWRGVVKRHLQRRGLTWEEAEVAAVDRLECRRCVTSLSTQYIRPSGVFNCRSDGLEFVAGRTERSSVRF